MPIATSISKALDDKPLVVVVKAILAVAKTLVRLKSDHDVGHRDIKPGNLYELDGQWLIGDFGLITIPGAETLTVNGKQVGPRHFTAYEMIVDPENADPHPADVYSLGKTMWVLATGQVFPPDGHQAPDVRGYGIGDFRPHVHARQLDQEVEATTRLVPGDRPTKEQVVRDLEAWLELDSEPVALDLSDARAAFHAKIKGAIEEQDSLERFRTQALTAIRRLQELTGPLNIALKDLYGRTRIDMPADKITREILRTYHPMYPLEVIHRWHRCTLVQPLDGPASPTLRMSRCLELMNDGTVVLWLMVHVAPEGVMGQYFNWAVSFDATPVGTIETEKLLQEGVEQMAEQLKAGIAVLIEKLPDMSNS